MGGITTTRESVSESSKNCSNSSTPRITSERKPIGLATINEPVHVVEYDEQWLHSMCYGAESFGRSPAQASLKLRMTRR